MAFAGLVAALVFGFVAVSALGQTTWRVTIAGPNDGQVTVSDVSADSQTQAEDLAWDQLRAASTTSAVGSGRCTKVASTTGSDSATGTEAAPFRTAQKLVSSLSSGQTGCLRAGTYYRNVKVSRAGITLTRPGDERALKRGRGSPADGVTVQGLVLDGVNAAIFRARRQRQRRRLPPQRRHQRAPLDLLRPRQPQLGPRRATPIEANRIHDCGRLPATNHDHGIYVAAPTTR